MESQKGWIELHILKTKFIYTNLPKMLWGEVIRVSTYEPSHKVLKAAMCANLQEEVNI